jgi:hypothetical protein
VRLDPTPGIGNDQPDALGGGETVRGNTLFVSLRASGRLAIVNVNPPCADAIRNDHTVRSRKPTCMPPNRGCQ